MRLFFIEEGFIYFKSTSIPSGSFIKRLSSIHPTRYFKKGIFAENSNKIKQVIGVIHPLLKITPVTLLLIFTIKTFENFRLMHSVGIVLHFGNVVAILISHEILLTTNYPNEKPTKQQINNKPSTVEGFRTSFVQKITARLLHPWEI